MTHKVTKDMNGNELEGCRKLIKFMNGNKKLYEKKLMYTKYIVEDQDQKKNNKDRWIGRAAYIRKIVQEEYKKRYGLMINFPRGGNDEADQLFLDAMLKEASKVRTMIAAAATAVEEKEKNEGEGGGGGRPVGERAGQDWRERRE